MDFLPADMQAKVSVMLPCRLQPGDGARPRRSRRRHAQSQTDLTLAQIAAIRAVVDVPLDIYVEVPDNVGGFVRLHEIPEIVRVAAPVYLSSACGTRRTSTPPAPTSIRRPSR